MAVIDTIRADMASVFSTDGVGMEMTYAPADPTIDSFTVTVIPGTVEPDQLIERHVYGDVMVVHVPASQIAAGGISGPVRQMGGQAGDTLAWDDALGESETWMIIGVNLNPVVAVYELTIERNIRIVP